jgi:(p)ppGpp synthase/HD superfamily hydrolase
MKYLAKIQKAIRFSIKTHEVYQKQKRKGKDIAYITHPLTVGIILSGAGASEDVIVAGILHDTVEDSPEEKKVTVEMLEERFGKAVAEGVLSVTETDKNLLWEERKKQALEHIREFSRDSLLIKSADVIANVSELVDDYARQGEKVFESFSAPKEKILNNHLEVIRTVAERWEENPLLDDLLFLTRKLREIEGKRD